MNTIIMALAVAITINSSDNSSEITVEFATTSFLEIIADGKTPILYGHILSATKQESDPSLERWILVLRIEKELSTKRWQGPNTLRVIYARFANPIQRGMQAGGWNNVSSSPGTQLVVGVDNLEEAAKATPPSPIPVKSVAAVQDRNDPIILGIDQSLQIETMRDIGKRKAMIAKGLSSDLAILRDYCHYACGRLQRISRSDAVELELRVLEDKKERLDNRMAAEVNLELELWNQGDPEDIYNKQMLSAFLNTLDTEDKELRRMLLETLDRVLFINVPHETHSYQQKILKDIAPHASSLSILQHCVTHGPASLEARKILNLVSPKK